jgi:UDP-N-acetyl-alpha-D-muramoyl-L-alanyl-L-glutamate epimerase
MVPTPKYFEFTTTTADWESGELSFSYRVELENGTVHEFSEKLVLPEPVEQSKGASPAVQAALRLVHMLLGTSYFKLFGPAEIRHHYRISELEADYWNTMYTQGMGEYYYVNDLEFEGRVSFPFEVGYQPEMPEGRMEVGNRALIMHGGGKDSIVSVEIARKAGVEFDLFAMNESDIQQAVAGVMGEKTSAIKKTIDPRLIELNKAGTVYNGHVPIAAIYSALAVLYGLLRGYRYVVVSNEHSATYGNVDYKGLKVNHQWDKSESYEDLFRSYLKQNITSDLEFFSLLRPLYEIKIAEIFSHFPQYFEAFSSSNHNFLLDSSGIKKRWSVDYSKGKVEFVWAILSAFLPRREMLRIFQEDIYARADVLDKYKELLGVKDIKPLECVGTPEETQVAMYLAHKRGEFEDTPVMRYFVSDVLPTIQNTIAALTNDAFSYGDDSRIPSPFKEALSAIMKLQ